MNLSFKIKHHFFSAFREFFVHNHNSLEFRAKVFALIIAANEYSNDSNYEIVKKLGIEIYKNDEDRANLLMISTKELVQKVRDNNGLDLDILIANIQQELKDIPRYAKKIDVDSLKELTESTHDKDTLSYQENILEFLQNLKDETLHTKKVQIQEDEEKLESRY